MPVCPPIALRLEIGRRPYSQDQGHRWLLEEVVGHKFWMQTDILCGFCGKLTGVPNAGGVDAQCPRCHLPYCDEDDKRTIQRFYDILKAVDALRLMYQATIDEHERGFEMVAENMCHPFIEQIQTLLKDLPFKINIERITAHDDFFRLAPREKQRVEYKENPRDRIRRT